MQECNTETIRTLFSCKLGLQKIKIVGISIAIIRVEIMTVNITRDFMVALLAMLSHFML